jgi:hypothetical protein
MTSKFQEYLRRFGFYLFGFAIGMVALTYIYKKKNYQFDYGANARTLKSIRNKTVVYSPEVSKHLFEKTIDSTILQNILTEGKVDFSQLNRDEKPCKTYLINATDNSGIKLEVIRCDSLATVNKVIFSK